MLCSVCDSNHHLATLRSDEDQDDQDNQDGNNAQDDQNDQNDHDDQSDQNGEDDQNDQDDQEQDDQDDRTTQTESLPTCEPCDFESLRESWTLLIVVLVLLGVLLVSATHPAVKKRWAAVVKWLKIKEAALLDVNGKLGVMTQA